MKFTANPRSVLLLLIVVSLLLVACSSGEDEVDAESKVPCTDLAIVESVAVEHRSGGSYAIVTVVYPDSCTRVSDMQQEVQGDTMEITICTARPPGVACAQMIAQVELEILLETGGLESGEYTVVVNDTGCIMNISGALRRRGVPIRVIHLARILAGEVMQP